jgi:ACDE family multidrug resistance protein
MEKEKRLYVQGRLQLIFAVTLMGVMGVSLISPALPEIMAHFGLTREEIGLLVTAFTLPGVLIALFIGVLADRLGRKQVLVPCLLLFGFAGGACIFAPDFSTLLILRVFQGIGGSGLVTLSITLIGDYYHGVVRAEAMGFNASALSIGAALYPIIGGILGSYSWYAPFLLFFSAVPIGLLSLGYLTEPARENELSLRAYGRRLAKIATRGDTLVAALAAFLAFILLYGGILTYFPLLLSERFHQPPIVRGILTSLQAVMVAIVSSQAGRLAARFSKRALFTSGFIGYGTGLFLIPFIHHVPGFVLPIMIFGLGHGLVVPNIQTFMTELAPGEFRAATISLYNMSLRLGQTIGPLLLAGISGIFNLDAVFLFSGILGFGTFLLLLTVGKILT